MKLKSSSWIILSVIKMVTKVVSYFLPAGEHSVAQVYFNIHSHRFPANLVQKIISLFSFPLFVFFNEPEREGIPGHHADTSLPDLLFSTILRLQHSFYITLGFYMINFYIFLAQEFYC